MTAPLVLSLFPGIGLLDMAFEEEGFCVVRGPDLLWGGDIKRFHPTPGRFDGVIGGPPCQCFSRLRYLVEHNGYTVAENLIPEFERCLAEAAPEWFLMENVPQAPEPNVGGYKVRSQLLCDVCAGGETTRTRRFCFGTHDGRSLGIETLALHRSDPAHAVLAHGGAREIPVAIGGSGKPKQSLRAVKGAAGLGYQSRAYFEVAKKRQGLPEDFDLPPFTVEGKIRALGNGVPLAMGRAVARAVKAALQNQIDKLGAAATAGVTDAQMAAFVPVPPVSLSKQGSDSETRGGDSPGALPSVSPAKPRSQETAVADVQAVNQHEISDQPNETPIQPSPKADLGSGRGAVSDEIARLAGRAESEVTP